MVLHLVRVFFLLTILAIIFSYAYGQGVLERGATYVTAYILLPAMAAFLLVLVDILWHRKRLQVLSGLFFGVLAGLVIAYALTLIVDLFVQVFPQMSGEAAVIKLLKFLLSSAAVFLCVTFVLQTKDDFRFIVPYIEFSKQIKGSRTMLLDTSVIIDGRIADIADTSILESQLVVPRFVLTELQAIADSGDKLKRNRGRRGLDMLKRLQNNNKIDIQILDTHAPSVDAAGDVDTKLVALAKHLDGRVATNDFNLKKIAELRGVDVVSINDLANALKPVVLPGEAMNIKIIKPGEESGQGIGYLPDGTMVVVEQGRDHIGSDVTLTVTSALQTSAGRMIFGKLSG